MSSEGSNLIQTVKQNMTVSEMREWKSIDLQTNRMWRNFWVRCLKNRGYSNSAIAEAFEISESTIRTILK